MGLSNASKRARLYTSTTNQNQGGGDKKAGFPYQVGRSSWTSIALGSSNYGVRCCKLGSLKLTANPNVRQSRPTGTTTNVPYWNFV
jgi:hypothetical protein